MTLVKEWEVARDVIAKADDRIDGLRKYGFTFVTTLLTADALALHSTKDGVAADANAIPWIALGVSVVASVLVVAMRLLEKATQLLQTAAAQRAQVIERHIGFELCDIIVERYEAERWWWQANALYCLFAIAVGFVGILAGGWETSIKIRCIVLVAVAVLSCASILWISSQEVSYRRTQQDDWSLDRTHCSQGDAVRIMYTRFGATNWPFKVGDPIWSASLHVISDEPSVVQPRDPLASHVANGRDMRDLDCKVWIWNTGPCPPGLYDIRVHMLMTPALPNGVERIVNWRKRKGPPSVQSDFVLRRRVLVTAPPAEGRRGERAADGS
jgi:hypothetical protein